MMKGYQKIKQKVDECKTTIDQLKKENEVLKLERTKTSDKYSSSKHSEDSGKKSLLQHISEEIKKHDTNSSIQSIKTSKSAH